jgi:single-strand DNA-binding protein
MNKWIGMGRMTKDPVLTYTQAKNTAVCKFTLAVDRQFTAQGEDKQADFINCVAWSKTAEFVSKYFTKGLRVALVGRLQTRSWDDDDGKKHYATEVVAESVYFADSKREQKGDAYEPQTGQDSTPAEFSGQDQDNDDNGDSLPF